MGVRTVPSEQSEDRTKDVLISATAGDLAHKRPLALDADEDAYWRVAGTPRQTAPGRRVWFADRDAPGDTDRVIGWGEITALEDGRLYFDGARDVCLPCLDDPPSRGFTYVDPVAPRLRDEGLQASVTVSITPREALGGTDPMDVDDETVEDFLAIERNSRRKDILRDTARAAIDESTLPEATSLLWIDRAEVYTLCGACFHEDREAMWTGSTENPNYRELREHMQTKLQQGTPCTNCRADRIRALADDLAERIDVEVLVDR